MIQKLLLSILVIGSAVACSSHSDTVVKATCIEGELKTIGVFGGKTLSTDSDAGRGIVMLIKGNPMYGTVEICTGTLIDQNIILTAAHCVPASEDATEMNVAFSGDPVCQIQNDGRTALKKVDRVIRNPSYLFNHSTDNDLALLRLEKKAPESYKSHKLIDHEVQLNSQTVAYVAGYGKSSDYNTKDSDNPVLKVAAIKPLVATDENSKITKSNSSSTLYFDQRDGQGACAGDSGGPTFLKENNNLYVLGVNSAVDSTQKTDFQSQDEVTCRLGLRIVSVYGQRTWISDKYKELLNSDSLGNQFQ